MVSAQTMAQGSGTTLVCAFPWNTTGVAGGEYPALVSYAADGNTFNGQSLERVRIGDTFITGPVALDATVAHDATVAKDATVAHLSDLATISPDQSPTVLAIRTRTDTLPAAPADQSTILQMLSLLTDVHDAQLGSWSVDKTQNPKELTFKRLDGSVLATFQVTEDANSAALKTWCLRPSGHQTPRTRGRGRTASDALPEGFTL